MFNSMENSMATIEPWKASIYMADLNDSIQGVMDDSAWESIQDGGVESLSQLDCLPEWQLLGAGHFSAVFEHIDVPGIAFKVGFKKEDSGAMYAAWCRDKAGMLHIPTILHIEQVGPFYMVAMPKYIPWDSDGFKWHAEDSARQVARALRSSLYECSEFYSVTFPALAGTLRSIYTFFADIAQFDLHGGNYMLDEAGQIVITDPVSFKRGVTRKSTTEKQVVKRPAFNFLFGKAPKEEPCGVIKSGSKKHLQLLGQKAEKKPSKLLMGLVGGAVKSSAVI
jgi:hypothetical protein